LEREKPLKILVRKTSFPAMNKTKYLPKHSTTATAFLFYES
jgi:hypothetical protein